MTTRTSVQQSLAALVACDQSYLRSTTTGEAVKVGDPLKVLPDSAPGTTSNEALYTDTTPFVVPAGYVVKAVIERPDIGAKAVIYQNAATNETMVAFGGTDGPNAQDHVANTQSFGWSQWERLNKVSETNSKDTGLLARLAELHAETGTIHFTGQSLGGALAQYATMSYVDQQQKAAAAVGETYSPSKISLTTFNGLGGKAGLEANGFSESLLSGLGQVAHYVVDNDLVSRLGGGHVGANGEVIRLDWRYNSGIHEGRPMDVGDSHRIETAFYTHLRTDGSDLAEGAVVTERSAAFPLVDTPNAIYWAQACGNLGNRNGDVTGFESVLRLVAGAIGAGVGASLEEVNGVARAYALTQYRSGEMSFRTYYVIESGFAGALYKALSGAVAGSLYILAIAAANTLDTLESMAKGGISMADAIEKYFREFRFDGNLEIAAAVAKIFALATVAPALKDPLTLDLDNNGLDTTGIAPANPILFDHDADGIKTATGWIKASDAFLVLDRNGNGTIDNGRELFGDATPLYAGGLAADGFAALAQEDTNHDGLVNAADARFASLRLWTDLNQDGVSQGGELSTLAQKGIAALIVAKTENAVVLGNGNQIADLGGYIRSDGSGGTLGAAEQMADIDLASNPFFSEFSDSIALTEAAQARPDMNGAGQVRSLQQAASLATPEGQALASQLAVIAAAPTRTAQRAMLDDLLKAWADTSTMATTASGAFAGIDLTVSFAGVGAGSTAYQAWLDKLTILERFNGRTFLPVPAAGTTLVINFYSTREALLNQSYASLKESVYAALVVQTRLKPYLDSIELKIDDSGITLDYTAMMTRLDTLKVGDAANAALDLLDLHHYAGGQLTGWNGMDVLNAWVDDPQSGSAVTAALAATELAHSGIWSGSSYNDFALGGTGADQLSGNDGDDVLMGMRGDDILNGNNGTDVLDGGAGNDTLTDYSADPNTLLGGAGNDTLNTGNTSNTLDGGAGDDLIKLVGDRFYSNAGNINSVTGGTGNDRLLMGGGTDTYIYSRGDGQDTINDFGSNYYNQAIGADRIVFGAGIVAGDLAARRVGDNLIVRINDPANPAATDQITIEAWFNSDIYRIESFVFADGNNISKAQMNVLGNVQTGTDAADTLSDNLGDSVIDGGAGNDVLTDYTAGTNTLLGGAGNDTLNTGNTSNTLDGGAGDDLIKLVGDRFYSNAGNINSVTGGTGNDRLLMGGGTDTYIYSRGDGQDTINDFGSNYYNQAIGADRIVFGAGIVAGDLAARRVGDNLIVRINDPANPAATDQITIEAWFNSDIYRIESFVFADSSSISKAQMNVLGNVQTGTDAADTLSDNLGDSVIDGGAGNDILTDFSGGTNLLRGGMGNDYLKGNAGADTLSGDAGNDSLLGGTGNDTLDGGAGDDYLEGNAGSDTYIFRRGDGYDTLYVADSATGKVDTLRLDGLAPDEVRLEKQGSDLVFIIKDSGEWTKVQGFFTSPTYQLDSVQFGDGTTWNRATLIAQPIWINGSSGDDALTGGSGNDFYNGGDGNDTLTGNAGNDSLNGGPGDDILSGGIGDDTLDGGLGTDQMAGGPGNDTYIFQLGNGSDRIVDGAGRDTLLVGNGLNEFGLEAERSGDNLAIHVIDSADSVTLDNWYDQVEGIDRIVFGDGTTLDRAGIDGLRNRPPTANPDSISVHEDGGALNFAAADLLTNDIDPNPGDVLTVIGVGTSQVGATVALADGHVRYDIGNAFQQLAEGEVVHDSFGYTITDSKGAQASSLVNVDIIGTNDAPVTAGDTAATLEDALDPIAGDVLANDSDVDHGTALRIVAPGDYLGAYGRLSLAADGSYAYVLDNASLAVQALAHTQVVVDHFTHHVTDGIAAAGSALDISVTGINDAPVTAGDTGLVAEDGVILATGNLLANDADVDAGTALQVAAPGNYLGAYGTLALAADGSYTYSLNNDSLAVQALVSGTAVVDRFAYAATDGLVATDSVLDITVLGTNDAPVTVDDADTVVENRQTVATGNVLTNDHDVDAGTALQVAEPGTYAGNYGSLMLGADGGYTYTLDNTAAGVQSLGREAAVVEHFGYTATDGQIDAGAVLDVFFHGTNDAPVVVKPLTDHDVTFNKPFSWQIPVDSFKDVDAGDTLTYTAKLADGSALPNWLHFDPQTLSFSGMSPKAVMSLDVRMTVTDKVAATGSTVDSLSVSDTFRLSINHGNQGVGNGQDAPPAGQTTNFNDGVGTSPGTPGAKSGNNGMALNSTTAGGSLGSTSAAPAMPSITPAVPTYLGLKDWQQYGPSASVGTVASDAAAIFARWLAVDLAVSQALAGNGPVWLDDGLGADTASLHMATSGYLGSTNAFGKDAFSLLAGSGQNLKDFKGLAEGIQKIA